MRHADTKGIDYVILTTLEIVFILKQEIKIYFNIFTTQSRIYVIEDVKIWY